MVEKGQGNGSQHIRLGEARGSQPERAERRGVKRRRDEKGKREKNGRGEERRRTGRRGQKEKRRG